MFFNSFGSFGQQKRLTSRNKYCNNLKKEINKKINLHLGTAHDRYLA